MAWLSYFSSVRARTIIRRTALRESIASRNAFCETARRAVRARTCLAIVATMEGKANTQLTVKLEGQEELVTFDQTLESLLPNHGFSTGTITSLRSRWNIRARTWAEEQGTLPGHAQKIAHGSKWKTVLPNNLADPFLRPLVRNEVGRRQQEIENNLADLNAMRDHLNNFMNQQ